MTEMRALRSVDEALSQLLAAVVPCAVVEDCPLALAAGRVTAAEIIAGMDVPPHTNSAMDGFAISSRGGLVPGTVLPVVRSVQAGHPAGSLEAGTAVRIFTGAALPEGADTIVIQENAEFDGRQLRILEQPAAGQHIRAAGHDIRCGQTVLPAGEILRPQHLGLLASLGITALAVYRPLRVAIINTGDELVKAGQPLASGQIYDSNSHTLRALLQAAGFECVENGSVGDDLPATRDALMSAAGDADCIISSGGVSVGAADYIKEAVSSLGGLSLWKLAIKPGKPFAFGHVGSCPFFGLPGNPVAVFVTFLLLVKPALLKMQGAQPASPPVYRIRAAFSWPRASDRQEYLRVRLASDEQGENCLQLFPDQGSSVMSSLAWATGLAVMPAQRTLQQGELLDYLPFTGLLT